MLFAAKTSHCALASILLLPFSKCFLLVTTVNTVLKNLQKVSDEENIDFHAKDNLGWTQFIKACINGHKEIIKSLLEYTDNKTLISMQKTFMVRLFGVILKH